MDKADRPRMTLIWVLLGTLAVLSFSIPYTLSRLRGAEVDPEPADSIKITGVIRDFRATHADFDASPDAGYGHYAALVSQTLGADRLPAFIGVREDAEELTEFDIVDGKVVPSESFAVMFTVQGAAIQTGSDGYHSPVTMMTAVGGTETTPFGPFDDPVLGNLNDDESATGDQHPGSNPRSHVLPTVFTAGQSVAITGRSWKLKDSDASVGLSATDWIPSMTVDSADDSPQVHVLRDGDVVPTVEGVYGQDSIADYVAAFIDTDTGTVKLNSNQVIYLFELGTTNLNDDAADFQDLVVILDLATDPSFFEIPGSESSDTTEKITTGGSFKVESQWRDGAGRPIAPHLTTTTATTDACGNPFGDAAGTVGSHSNGGIESKTTFTQWFRDVLGTNLSQVHAIELDHVGGGVYEFATSAFHPIDNALLGNGGLTHNYHFTWSFSGSFVYHGCTDQFFQFEGDDDAWLFIDGDLVMDLGGVLPGTEQFVQMDRLDLVDGQRYPVRFFFAQRQSLSSDFHMRTNIFEDWNGDQYTISSGFD